MRWPFRKAAGKKALPAPDAGQQKAHSGVKFFRTPATIQPSAGETASVWREAIENPDRSWKVQEVWRLPNAVSVEPPEMLDRRDVSGAKALSFYEAAKHLSDFSIQQRELGFAESTAPEDTFDPQDHYLTLAEKEPVAFDLEGRISPTQNGRITATGKFSPEAHALALRSTAMQIATPVFGGMSFRVADEGGTGAFFPVVTPEIALLRVYYSGALAEVKRLFSQRFNEPVVDRDYYDQRPRRVTYMLNNAKKSIMEAKLKNPPDEELISTMEFMRAAAQGLELIFLVGKAQIACSLYTRDKMNSSGDYLSLIIKDAVNALKKAGKSEEEIAAAQAQIFSGEKPPEIPEAFFELEKDLARITRPQPAPALAGPAKAVLPGDPP